MCDDIGSSTSGSMIDDDSNIIKEFHFHVYFFQEYQKSYKEALEIREKIILNVSKGNFIGVCSGVTAEMLPGLNQDEIPPVNIHPIGPHPCGSFEVWVPQEWFANAMSFFLREHGTLSILIHPLTSKAIDDHTKHAMWIGPPYRLDLHVFDDSSEDPPQYPQLKLGYSADRSLI